MSENRDRRSNRICGLTQSYIRRMTRECDRVGGINLGQGVCDLPTPKVILQAASEAVKDDLSSYSKYEGIDELREQIAQKARSFNGLENVDARTDIVVSIGSTGAFNCVLQGLFDVGDRVIVFEPYYRNMAEDYRGKRELICGTLAEVGLTPYTPEGAYYVLADINSLGFEDDRAAAMHILEKTGVACVPGSAFFVSDVGKRLARFCFAKRREELEKACTRLHDLRSP